MVLAREYCLVLSVLAHCNYKYWYENNSTLPSLLSSIFTHLEHDVMFQDAQED